MRLSSPLVLLLVSSAALAHESDVEEIVVTGRQQILTGEARSASEGVVGQMDLAIRPMLRPGEGNHRASPPLR